MATSRKLPIFVFPEELKFNETNHKQVLTIYNPYDVPLKYKSINLIILATCINIFIIFLVLSNSPLNYKVMGPQGTIRSHCCVDMCVIYIL